VLVVLGLQVGGEQEGEKGVADGPVPRIGSNFGTVGKSTIQGPPFEVPGFSGFGEMATSEQVRVDEQFFHCLPLSQLSFFNAHEMRVLYRPISSESMAE
jgi:hypothetical protein